ncbi:MAG: AAA family ATPase, partial [Eubacteriales bacterium]|nr:AAA family ATPase [Eubacteriales bacterium]
VNMFKELKHTQLKKVCKESILKDIDKFEYTDAIGQEKAIEALKFGLSIKNKAYNIYVSGQSGSGRTTFSEKYTKQIAQNEKTPDDILYVYNFKEPKYPKLLKLKAGKGKEFKNDIDELIHLLSIEIPKTFSSKELEEEKEKIIKEHNEKKEKLIQEITEIAKQNDFGIKNSSSSIYFMPIIDGVTISEEEYEELEEEEKKQIDKRSEILQEDARKVMKSIKELEKEMKKQIDKIEYNLGLFTIGRHLDILQNKYIENKYVSEYLVCLKEDILENIENFIEEEIDEEEPISLIPLISKKNEEEILAKYKVNLIVDNSETKGAPVIVNYNPNYTNLIGEIEFENELGNFTTDYMKIKGGLLHKANGGYLILHIEDILKNYYVLESLFRILKTGELHIEPLKELYISGISVATIKPEPLKIDIKIILIGSEYYYDVLYDYEEDFKKLFKIHSIFDYEMKSTEENIKKIAKFIKNFEEKEKTLEFDKSAIKAIIEHSYRISGNQNTFTTRFNI